MSYLGGLLLMVIEDEEKVFWALVSLLERFKYLRGYYDHNMERYSLIFIESVSWFIHFMHN